MKICPNCNNELSDEAKFCNGCGSPVENVPVQDETVAVAPAATQEETVVVAPAEVPVEEQIAAEPKQKKQISKKTLMFAGIGVAVVALIVVLVVLFIGKGEPEAIKTSYAMYLKDGDLFFMDFKNDDEPWQVTSDLSEMGDIYLADFVRVSEDGKYIFFPDRIVADNFTLYYKEKGNEEAEAIKIDSDLDDGDRYHVNSSASLVTYTKGSSLYQYDMSKDDKEKIASDVKRFAVSDDGKKIIYRNSEGGVYIKYEGKDKEKIASEITSIKYLSDDFSTMIYTKDDSVYKYVEGKDEAEKIASDVFGVIKIYKSGEMYYFKKTTEKVSLKDFVIDDKKDSDAALRAPTSPSIYRSDYDTYAEYSDAYDKAWDKYYADRDEYYAKQNRDNIREELEDRTIEKDVYTLYFYNGKESVVVGENCDRYDYDYAADSPVVYYEVYAQSGSKTTKKMSEIDSIYDIEELTYDSSAQVKESYVAVKGKATNVGNSNAFDKVEINDAGNTIYYLDKAESDENTGYTNEISVGDLYCISIKKGNVGKAEKYDEEVYEYSIEFVDNKICYFKDVKDGKGDLYVNKNRIDSDVDLNRMNVMLDEKTFIYFVDWNSEKQYGTLKFYNGKKSEKIADDVHAVSVTEDGHILYLDDYSINNKKGTLNEWFNGKKNKLDDDVSEILIYIPTKYFNEMLISEMR